VWSGNNARYPRCRLVQDLAAVLGIELLFLPAYSPDLDLIERLGLGSLSRSLC